MPTEEGFLQAIRDEPDDLTHWLVFADWLEDHGDSRAEFIRVQCRLEQLDESDPQYAALEEQESELRARHEQEWLGEIAGYALDCRYRRGLLDRVTMYAQYFATEGARLFERHPVA